MYLYKTGVPEFVDKMIISAKNLNELNLKQAKINPSHHIPCNSNLTHSDKRVPMWYYTNTIIII